MNYIRESDIFTIGRIFKCVVVFIQIICYIGVMNAIFTFGRYLKW